MIVAADSSQGTNSLRRDVNWVEALYSQRTQLIDFVIEGDGNRDSAVGVVTRLGDAQRGIFVWFCAVVQHVPGL